MNEPKYIMAIDPGGTSGIAFRMPNRSIITCVGNSPEDVYDLIRQAATSGLQQVVCENFNAQYIGKWGLHTVRIVGGVQAVCHIFQINLQMHMPQKRYPFKLKARGILKGRRVVIHEIEALEHLLTWEYDNDIKVE